MGSGGRPESTRRYVTIGAIIWHGMLHSAGVRTEKRGYGF